MNDQIKIDFDREEKKSEVEHPLTLIRKGIIERTFERVIKKYGSLTESSLNEFGMKWGVNLYREEADAEETARWINEFSQNKVVEVSPRRNDHAGNLYELKLISKS